MERIISDNRNTNRRDREYHDLINEDFKAFITNTHGTYVPIGFYGVFMEKLQTFGNYPLTKEHDIQNDQSLIRTAELLLSFHPKNPSEASFALHYASAASLLREARDCNDKERKENLVLLARDEFEKIELGIGTSNAMEVNFLYRLAIKIIKPGYFSNAKKLKSLADVVEGYFTDPGNVRKITRLVKLPTHF